MENKKRLITAFCEAAEKAGIAPVVRREGIYRAQAKSSEEEIGMILFNAQRILSPLRDEDVSPYEAADLDYGVLLIEDDILGSPNKAVQTLLNAEYAKKATIRKDLAWGDNVRFRTALTSVVEMSYREMGEELPASYRKLFFDDAGRKFVRSRLMSLVGAADEESDNVIGKALHPHLPSVIGSVFSPISERLSCAMIWHEPHARHVLASGRRGEVFFVEMTTADALTNEQALRRIEEDMVRVSQGHTTQLRRSSHPALDQLLLSADDPSSAVSRAQEDVVTALSENRLYKGSNIQLSEESFVFDLIGRRLAEGRENFTRCLPRELTSFLTMNDLFTPHVAGWFSGHPDLVPDPDAQRKATDVQDAFFASGALFSLAKHEEFRRAVSERKEILPLIREVTGFTKAQVRAISAMPLPAKKGVMGGSIPPFDPDIFRIAGIEEILDVSPLYDVLARANPKSPPSTVASWVADHIGDKFYDARNLADYREELNKRLILPLLEEVIGADTAEARAFVEERVFPKTPKQALMAEKTYHDEMMWSSFQRKGSRNHLMSWSPLTVAMTEDNVTVREIHTGSSLMKQGHAQSHCVATYQDSILRGGCLILSVDVNGGISSTVELWIRRGGVLLESVQHRAKHNMSPSSEDILAVERFLKKENERLTPADVTEYLSGLQDVRMAKPNSRSGEAEYAFSVFAPALPKKVAQAGFARLRRDLMDAFEIEEFCVERQIEPEEFPEW